MTHFEKIEAYIEGWMTGPERAAFESELQTNAALKQDYEDWLEADAILKKNLLPANDAAIKEIVTPLTRQYFKQEKKQPAKVVSLKKYMISVAAAAAIIIIYFSVPAGIDNYNVPEMPQAVVRGSEALSNKGALVGLLAEDDPVFTVRCRNHEFVRSIAADGTAFGFNRQVVQPATREDAAISAVHLLIDFV